MATSSNQYKTAIKALIRRLNIATGSPLEPYERVNDRLYPCANNFHLDNQNSHYSLRRMSAEAGCSGSSDVLNASRPLSEIYNMIGAFVAGVEMGKELPK